MPEKTYIAIDLKSFYASVECAERGLDPMTTHLVVADPSRTEKTICLAVSPSLRALGVPGRARLFEVVEAVRRINARRLGRREPTGKSFDAPTLERDQTLALDYVVAPPQMRKYMAVSRRIYEIYTEFVDPQDVHVYSVDEVFIDATSYLKSTGLTAHDFARRLIGEVLRRTGITATAGIGPNLYLCKIALDIEAKHIEPDADGVRVAVLTERSYREQLWDHRPLTDFWRVGPGIARKLEQNGVRTMGELARASVDNEDLLYRLFGVNAELLIDHAWGWEPCTIADIKSYRPENNSISSGQVLPTPYPFEKGRLVVREMADLLSLELVDKGLVCDQMVLTVGYDIENLADRAKAAAYRGPVTTDRYGRKTPKAAHGSHNLGRHTSSTRLIVDGVTEIWDRTVDRSLTVRRMYVVANHVIPESEAREKDDAPEQLDLFTDYGQKAAEEAALEREKRMQSAMLTIRRKYGKNAILKGMNLEEGATAVERNKLVGGHKASKEGETT